MNSNIRITYGKGFHLTIGNYTISVRIGHSNYCARGDYSKFGPETGDSIKSPDCEIAVWTTTPNQWVTKKVVRKVLKAEISDNVMGWVNSFQVGQIIAWMTKQARKDEKKKENFHKETQSI